MHDTPVVEVGEAAAVAAPETDHEPAPGFPAEKTEPSHDAPSPDADTGDGAADSVSSEVEDVEESVEVDESATDASDTDDSIDDDGGDDGGEAAGDEAATEDEAVEDEAVENEVVEDEAVEDEAAADEAAGDDAETVGDGVAADDQTAEHDAPGADSETDEPSAGSDSAPVFTAPSCAVIDEFTEQLIHTKSATSGPVVDDAGSTVRFRRMSGIPGTLWSWLLALVTLSLSVAYAVWLLRSGPPLGDRILRAAGLAAAAVVVATLAVEVLRLLLIGMLSMATSLVRKPVPVKPHKNLKVAVLVTFVPISESLTMLDETLRAAQRLEVPHGTQAGDDDDPALIDIFVLDEGDPDHPHAVQETIDRLNASPGHRIHRVSRYGIGKYHRGKKFATKTKHGNVNAAYEMIRENPEYPRYDVLIGLDPDHVPMPELTSRLCGYFNDPDVAYVAAPQAYANSTVHVVAKLAESQQFVFHSLIQPAANSYGGPMLVGTNYALRTSVFEQIDGAQPSITEDLATGLKALSNRNPDTGRRWTAVYTPDVLAHGEGPNTWGAYFKQQNRWATGAIRHVIAGPFIFQMMKTWHSPRRVLHYSLLMAFYPVMAVTWILGAVNAGLFALSGGSGTVVDPGHWVLFYTWTIIAQVTIFIAARRHNVSPYESANSWGVYGMFMSVAAAPIYVSALLKSLVTSNPTFDVTPKGGTAANRDSLFTFRLSLFWAVLYVVIAWRIITTGYGSVATLTWPAIALFLSLAPVVIWLAGTPRRRRRRADDPGPATTPAEDTALVAIAAKDG
ncbi:hypothetical protein GCM10022231_09000 [Gordonia caeni]|uniref:Glycosyltransferase 2-like domain-containing protein n=1 Tax=Gordonia caeni TaxID=1007097 RepID=A0ABP7NT17_9ACTN